MACSSVFLTVMAFVLGIVCRMNFGKGLLRYRQFILYFYKWLLSMGSGIHSQCSRAFAWRRFFACVVWLRPGKGRVPIESSAYPDVLRHLR